jgi:lipopolysaccharide transport system permease protein
VRDVSVRRVSSDNSAGSMIPSALNPLIYGQAFTEGLLLLTRHRRLLIEMTKRDLTQRYSNQILGSLWIIGHPLFLTTLYVFLFAVVFKTRINISHEMPRNYTIYLLSGLVPWLSFQTALVVSCSSIVANAQLVKQFVFHLEILPAKDVLTALVTWLVGIAVITIYTAVADGGVPLTYLFLPIALIAQTMAMIGVAFALSALTVFFRDLKEFVSLFVTAGPFVMPIVYLPEWVPHAFRPIIYANPLSYMAWVYQDILYFGRFEHPVAWVVYFVGSAMIFAFGYRLFRSLRPVFSASL